MMRRFGRRENDSVLIVRKRFANGLVARERFANILLERMLEGKSSETNG
jgi:hypothetical protein